jgi:hypothetical protein
MAAFEPTSPHVKSNGTIRVIETLRVKHRSKPVIFEISVLTTSIACIVRKKTLAPTGNPSLLVYLAAA